MAMSYFCPQPVGEMVCHLNLKGFMDNIGVVRQIITIS